MKKNKLILIVVSVILSGQLISCSQNSSTKNQNAAQTNIDYGSNKQVGKYIVINDIKVYYEIYGEGEPLLLMHGNGGSINNFMYQIPELSKYFKVIAVDSRGQGRTTDSDKEITYSLMASDMATLIDKLNLGSVNVLGWSDGGINGLELAYAYPDKVQKLITFGANYTHVNFIAKDDRIVMDKDDPIFIQVKPLREYYKTSFERLCPNPERLPIIKKKLNTLMEKYPNFSIEQLRTIKTPTLIVAGDHDLIDTKHTVTLFESLPNSQLFLVPGASHLSLAEQPELVNSVVIKFLKVPFRKIDRFYFLK